MSSNVTAVVLNWCSEEDTKLQTKENLGYTGDNNVGIRWAREHGADFIFILNNDTVVETDAVTRLVDAALREEDIGAVAPKILRLDAPAHVWYGGGAFDALRDFRRARAVFRGMLAR